MHVLWGSLMAILGLCMLAFATTRSQFIVYRMLVARSRILWGEGNSVHRFFQICGLILFVLGVMWALGMIWR